MMEINKNNHVRVTVVKRDLNNYIQLRFATFGKFKYDNEDVLIFGVPLTLTLYMLNHKLNRLTLTARGSTLVVRI